MTEMAQVIISLSQGMQGLSLLICTDSSQVSDCVPKAQATRVLSYVHGIILI